VHHTFTLRADRSTFNNDASCIRGELSSAHDAEVPLFSASDLSIFIERFGLAIRALNLLRLRIIEVNHIDIIEEVYYTFMKVLLNFCY